MALSGMTWSLNEVEALARKAAKGGGFSHGEAEDAGRAVRWLCSQSLDGAGQLAAYLDARPADRACPLRTGMALVDAPDRAANRPLGEVAEPLLLLPFVAQLADLTQRAWSLTSPTGFAAVAPGGMVILQGPLADRLSLFAGGHFGKPQARAGRAVVSEDTAARLQRWAGRTYAPATEESRQSGAGAGTADAD